jgi:hypothetical protein
MAEAVCTGCWTWQPASVRLCPRCGVALVAAEAAGPGTLDPESTATVTGPRKLPAQGGRWSDRRLRVVLIAAVAAALVLAVALPQFGLSGNPGCGLPFTACTRVLFIGDSYTYVNDLPDTFADLAWAAGRRVDAVDLSIGGGTLAGHVADPATASTISSQPWNTVVLQDQSEVPALPSGRRSEMYPAVIQLAQMIRNDGAQPLLFLTWGHASGWPQAGLDSYATMQAAVDEGYLGIADDVVIPIAPVGDAWQTVVGDQANPQLWQGDGVHPTTEGTYLAACVFYASIFDQSPVGLGYHDGLSDAEAAMLQRVAAATAITDHARWGLP